MFLISLICNYSHEQDLANQYYAEWEDFRKEYIGGVASYYGFTYEASGENQENYSITKDGETSNIDAVMEKLEASKGSDSETKAAYDKYLTLTPKEQVNFQYQKVYTFLFTMLSVGLLLAYLVLEFILPIIFKNGQTVGKKVFSICLVRPNCVKIPILSLFVRTFVGKYAIETMFPVALMFMFFFGGLGILSLVLTAAILLLNIILFFATKNRTPIHDIFAYTVAADMKLQMIFQSEEELVEKKTLQHEETVKASKS